MNGKEAKRLGRPGNGRVDGLSDQDTADDPVHTVCRVGLLRHGARSAQAGRSGRRRASRSPVLPIVLCQPAARVKVACLLICVEKA